MILYNPVCDKFLADYGIQIPIVKDRSSSVFESLLENNPNLKFFDPEIIPKISKEDLYLVHNKDFVDRLFGSYKELEKEMMICFELIDEDGKFNRYLPESAKYDFTHLFNIILKHVGMSYYSSSLSLKTGFSYFLGGGGHHAMTFGGRGFCIVNDIVIAIRKMQKEELIKTAWVIDVDAHKGDGTAELTFNDASITTLSIHMQNSWPLDSGNADSPWFIPSNIDIGILQNEEDAYLEKLSRGLEELKSKYKKPDIAIIVNGSDPYEHDELVSTNHLRLTKDQLLERDKMIHSFLLEQNIPQSYVMSGGYGKRSWEIYSQFLNYILSFKK